jgi:hypothetical protein
MVSKGRKTCDSVSALSLDAQPAQLDKVVSRICFPLGLLSFIGIIIKLEKFFAKSKSVLLIQKD